MKSSRIAMVLFLSLAFSVPLIAANRAFVSGNGVDTGTCLITAPCRSFGYALTQITTGGEIIALDTAGYGSMTISMSASIIAAPGATAFATASSGSVVVVAAGSSDVVTLHGITVTGNASTDGVVFSSGNILNIENCIINGHSRGILFDRPADQSTPELQVINCILRNNTIGLDVSNAPIVIGGHPRLRTESSLSPGLIYATVKECSFISNSGIGLYARDKAQVSVTDSLFAGNTNSGVTATGTDGSPSLITMDRCTLSGNGTGVTAGDLSGSGMLHGAVVLANCMITSNFNSMENTTNGQVFTRISNGVLTNTIYGNTNNASPTSTTPAQ